MRARKLQQGFSLLEVLVAFVITALALGVVFQIFGKGTTALGLGREYAQAIALAESQLAATSIDGATATMAGRFADQFDWRVNTGTPTVPPPPGATSVLTLRQVVVDVQWMSRGQPHTLQLTTLQPVLRSP